MLDVRRLAALEATLLMVGCAGKTAATSDGGVLADALADVRESGSPLTLSLPEAGLDASRCESDAAVDATEVQCGDAGTFRLYRGAGDAPYNCAVTPAEVTCNTTADCAVYPSGQCGCVSGAYGVSASCGPRSCLPPPCPPPPNGCQVTGFYTQDCHLVPALANVGVACVDHQCLTYAVGSP